MSLLQQLKKSVVTAAELAALLFVSPAFGAEPVVEDASAGRIAIAVRDDRAHVVLSRLVRNDSAAMLDLGRQLPAVDHHVESLQVVRGGHSVNVIAEGDCGDDLYPIGVSGAAHVRMALDEAVADALLLPPGDTAWIEIAATHPLPVNGSIERLELPWLTGTAAQAVAAERDDGTAVLLIAPSPSMRGKLLLQLRPDGLPARRIELGVVDAPGTVFLLALDRAALASLAAGAVELESVREGERIWSTLSLRFTAPVAALAADTSH